MIALFGVVVLGLTACGGAWLLPGQPVARTAMWIFVLDLISVGVIVIGIGQKVTGRLGGFALSGRYFYSLSRVQIAGWTVLVVGVLLACAEVRLFAGGGDLGDALNIEIPAELLEAVGIAAFSAAATPAILALKSAEPTSQHAEALGQSKVMAGTRASGDDVSSNGAVLTRSDPSLAGWRDIFTGDELATAGVVDISKVQQFLITGLLLGTYSVMVVTWLRHGGLSEGHPAFQELPPLNQSFINLLGISHAGYLTFKAVPKVAPEQT